MSLATYTKPIFALRDLPAGVAAENNSDMDAPQRHARINPTVKLTVLIDTGRRTGLLRRREILAEQLVLELTPYSQDDPTPIVWIKGGPREWWDLEEGYCSPSVTLDDLVAISNQLVGATANRRCFAATLQEKYGTRAITVASDDTANTRRIILGVTGHPAENVITWSQPGRLSSWGPDTVSCDPAELDRAISALRDAVVASEVITVPDSYFV